MQWRKNQGRKLRGKNVYMYTVYIYYDIKHTINWQEIVQPFLKLAFRLVVDIPASCFIFLCSSSSALSLWYFFILHASAVEFMIFPLQLLDVAESELPKVQCSVHICNQAPSPGCPGNCTGKDNSQSGYLQSVDFRQLFSSDLEISSTAGLLFWPLSL